MTQISIYDSTLRDGAQAQGISYTVADKLKIVARLDALGVDFIEAGNPGSNPKDLEFFAQIAKTALRHARLIAFGATRKPGTTAADDANLRALLAAQTSAVAIFGKSRRRQVEEVLRTSGDENLAMIRETLAFLKARGKMVVFDAEHFFDGYQEDAAYALATLRAAQAGGADVLCLCDTNGGSMPEDIRTATQAVVAALGTDVVLGIHCHNDAELAVANTLAAVAAGARQVQGTFNGIGERCGNANLCAIIPNLQIKLGYRCVPDAALTTLTDTARWMADIANMPHNEKAAFVGGHAFAHKGGMHIDAVVKNPQSYEHIDPEWVGNRRYILMSEVAGRSTLLARLRQLDPSLDKDSTQTQAVVTRLKALEHEGYQFEAAEASFELVVKKLLAPENPTFFELVEFKVLVTEPTLNGINASAILKVRVGAEEALSCAEGDGPVNALDCALRRALERFYPEIKEMRLTDYKVRVLDSDQATAAKVRVLVESADQHATWTTIGVSTDIINASRQALVDAIEYKLGKDRKVNV